MKSYAQVSASKLKAQLKSVSAKTARKALLSRGYSPAFFPMPEYYFASGFEDMNLTQIQWNKGKKPAYTNTLDVFTPKNGLSWRRFNLMHPYIFVHIVNEITEPANWKIIRNILTKETLVQVFSIPTLSLKKNQTVPGQEFMNWEQMAEKDLVKDCADYCFLITTDIKNFYPTIYTHAIAWAIHGKATAKQNRTNDLLGNRLDTLFRCSRDGQTNGIPTGSMASHFIGDILMADVDAKLTDAIKAERGLASKILILRYRDDYKILAKSADAGTKVHALLSKILHAEYNLHLNSDKTKSYDDILDGTFRPWVLALKQSSLLRRIDHNDFAGMTGKDLKDALIEIYQIQKRYPSGNPSTRILSKLSKALFEGDIALDIDVEEILIFVSLLRKLTLLREEATPQSYLILDVLLRKIPSKRDRKKILKAIKKVVSGKKDNEYQIMWLYRLCLSSLPNMCNEILKENNQPILRVVDRKYIKSDIKIFDLINISNADANEINKFQFINRNQLDLTRGNPINPASVNIFKY